MRNENEIKKNNDLPEGWALATLGVCADFLDNQRVPVNAAERAKRKGPFPYYGANGQVGWINDFIFDEELTLLAEDGGFFDDRSRGVAYVVSGKSWVNNHAHVLRALGGIPTKFIEFALNNSDLMPYVSGTTRLKLNQAAARRIPMPLAPLSEQHRIVEKLQKLLDRVRSANASIERVPVLLKQFRKAVLAAACSGKLVEQDPNDEPASTLLERIRTERKKKWATDLIAKGKDPKKHEDEEPVEPDTSGLPELPSGWVWTTTAMLASSEPHSFTDGPFGSNLKTADYTESGARVIRLQNLGIAEFKDGPKAFVSNSKFLNLKKHEAKPGDIVIAALADPVGRTCLVPDWIGDAIVKADCIRLRIDPRVCINRYIIFALNTDDHFKRAEAAAHGVGRLRVNFGDVKAFVVPLPPLAEQHRIVARVDEFFKIADTIEAAVAKAKANSSKVAQSLLAKAFRGELVEQDPKDEPASVLLERIKAEKAKTSRSTTNKKRR